MLLNKSFRLVFASLATFGIITSTEASLDLLAGVEAGIETATSMTATDLERTQKVLSTEALGSRHHWRNEETGNAYEIVIDHQYSYGHYPCLAYELSITKANVTETKSLDACKNSSGQWISISPATTAL
jgi:surface antigen